VLELPAVILTVIFLASVFLLAIAVWAALVLPRVRLPLLCALVLTVGTFFGPAFFAINGPLQMSADRLLFLGVVAMGTSLVLRGSLPIPKLITSDYLVIAMVGWYLFRAVTAGEPAKGINPLGTWIFYILLPGLIYGLVRISQPQSGDVKSVISVMIAIGVYCAVIGFFEARGLHSLVFPRYIADPKVWEFFGRARGPLLNPSANGILLTISLSFAVLRGYYGDRAAKATYGLIVLVIFLGIYSTLTRGVWIGGVLALAVIFWTPTPRWAKVLGLSAVVVFGGLAVLGLKDELLRMKRDKNLSAEESAKSIKLRPLLAVIAYEMVKDAPLAGHGFAVYQRAAKPYYQDRSYDMPLEQARGYFQHNIILSSIVDTGLIGVTLFTWILVNWTRTAWRLGHNLRTDPLYRMVGLGMIGSMMGYLVGGMFQDVLLMPMIQMYLYFLGGLTISISQTASESDVEGAHMRAPFIRTSGPNALPMGRRLTDPPCAAETPVVDEVVQPAAS